jgi:hypothetical protein
MQRVLQSGPYAQTRITDQRTGQDVCFSAFAKGEIYDAAFPKKSSQKTQKKYGRSLQV